jgi:hypothetical protein
MSLQIIRNLIKQTTPKTKEKGEMNMQLTIHDKFEIDFKHESKLIQQKQKKIDAKSINRSKDEKRRLEAQMEKDSKELSRFGNSSKSERELIEFKSNKIASLKSKIKQIENNIINTEKEKDINSLDVQYYKIYTARVAKLKKIYKTQGKVDEIANLKPNKTKTSRIVGTIFKKMSKCVSYLKQIEAPEFEDFEEKSKGNLFRKSDKVFIEDETGRVELILDPENKSNFEGSNWISQFELMNPVSLTTGTVICAHGFLDEQGIFNLIRFEFAANYKWNGVGDNDFEIGKVIFFILVCGCYIIMFFCMCILIFFYYVFDGISLFFVSCFVLCDVKGVF